MTAEETLAARWQAGAPGADEAITRQFYPGVLRFFELKYPSEAEDLAQQVFLAALEARERWTGRGSLRGYLFGIARFKLIERIRLGEKRRRLVRFGEEDEGQPRTRLSTLVARRQEHEFVLLAMRRLSVEQLMPLQLYYWEGLPTAEVADVLEIPKSTVTSRLARAREALGQEIRRLCKPGAMRERAVAELERWTREVSCNDAPVDEEAVT